MFISFADDRGLVTRVLNLFTSSMMTPPILYLFVSHQFIPDYNRFCSIFLMKLSTFFSFLAESFCLFCRDEDVPHPLLQRTTEGWPPSGEGCQSPYVLLPPAVRNATAVHVVRSLSHILSSSVWPCSRTFPSNSFFCPKTSRNVSVVPGKPSSSCF